MAQVFTGKVVWFSKVKGIGFVEKEDGSGDLFVHFSNIAMEGFKFLRPGQTVTYEVGENHKGAQAVNVKVVDDQTA